MKTSHKKLYFLPALMVGFGLILAGRTIAQTFTTLHSFTAYSTNPPYTNSDGENPNGLIVSGNTLYGEAVDSGSSGSGTLFAVNTNGTGFTNLYAVTALNNNTNSDGNAPRGGLILLGNTLYGTTVTGGVGGNGTVFAFNISSMVFTNLHSFTATSVPSIEGGTNSDGAKPDSGLVLSGNTFYGTTSFGGSSGNGTVFAVNNNGNGFTNLHSFTAVFSPNDTNSDGANPETGLIISGNTLCGTAYLGGTNGEGTVFSLTVPGPPLLTLILSGSNVILTWPTNTTGLTLQSTTNLVSSAFWITNSPEPVIVNGLNTVTNPISGIQEFFRLSQ